VHEKCNYKTEQLDILEVYAFRNSMLATVAQERGLRARRFTYEEGICLHPLEEEHCFM
jgi:hypothetical protein